MSSEAPPPAPKIEQVRHIIGWRRLLVLPFALLVRAWNASLRLEIDESSRALFGKVSESFAFVLWHNRLFVIAEIARRYRKGRRIYGLVSASKDGAWLEAFFEAVGIHSVRGSSSKLGREAVTALVDVMRQGNDIGITPDGPRGPCYDFKGGALIVSRRVHSGMVLVGMEFGACLRLRSWDRFVLPLPFSKVRIRGVLVTAEEASGDRDALVVSLRERMRALNPDR